MIQSCIRCKWSRKFLYTKHCHTILPSWFLLWSSVRYLQQASHRRALSYSLFCWKYKATPEAHFRQYRISGLFTTVKERPDHWQFLHLSGSLDSTEWTSSLSKEILVVTLSLLLPELSKHIKSGTFWWSYLIKLLLSFSFFLCFSCSSLSIRDEWNLHNY